MAGMTNHTRLIPVAVALMLAALATGCAADAPSTETVRSSAPVAAATPATSADLNGTYRWTLTQEDAEKAGDPEADIPGEYPQTQTVKLKDGELEGGCFGAAGGTYEVAGDRITFHSREYDIDSTVTFTVGEDGSLELTPVQPMDPGDAFQCFSKPWTKIE